MINKKQLQNHNTDVFFKLNPLAACVKTAIAGSMLMSIVTPAYAELPVPSAVWASMGGATREVIGNNMNIKQETDKVILNWETFNVSKESSVNFKQPSASSIALNKIGGENPSQILGTVTANGQILLVNKNGFVFGKDSVVNVHGLVASTLAISDQTFKDGMTKVVDIDQRAAFQGTGDVYQKNKDGSFKLDANGKKVKIEVKVDQGAKIKASEGGRILIMAPTITNSGSVEANGGQVIMAAATDKVYLQEAPTEAKEDNSDVRGLLVEVGTGGKVENLATGNIAANRGNVTLMGFAVNQEGKVSATTSTNVNGTIRLLAREGGTTQLINSKTKLASTATTRTADKGDELGRSAQVTLKAGSKTEILPEVEFVEETKTLASGETIKVLTEKAVIDGQKQPQSRVEIMAHKVHLQAGSEITAPGGRGVNYVTPAGEVPHSNVEITATKNPINPVANNSDKNDSRVLIDAGAKIDVSGTDTVVKSMESNVIDVDLRNFELKDAPLQKNGVLKGKTVSIDIREGSSLTDIQPTVASIKKTVAERLSKGGDISIKSEGDVVVEKGAVLDFSGGKITYRDGVINTTKLFASGSLIDISKADPLLIYDGIYGEVTKKYEKWGSGATQSWIIDGPFSSGRFEKGYAEGQDAGRLVVKANNVVLDGDLLGQTTIGRTQRSLSNQASAGYLEVNNGFSFNNVQDIIFSGNAQQPVDLNKVVTDALKNEITIAKIDAPLPTGDANTLTIQANKLLAGGIQQAKFTSNGKVVVADNATLKLAGGGKLTLKGGGVDVLGNIEGAGATVNLETGISVVNALDGDINIANGAYIGLQGAWINDFKQPSNLDGKSVTIKGGTFSAKAAGKAGGNVNLQAGSTVDVSGGAWLQSDRSLKAGDAGKVSLVAEPSIDNVSSNVIVDGILNAFGIERGGRFKVIANAVAIRREDGQASGDGLKPLQIGASFFGKGGFADFEIGSNQNGLTVEEGAIITLKQNNRLLAEGYLSQDNAAGIGGFSEVITLLPLQRAASSIILSSDHSAGSNASSKLTIEKNAKINADDLSNVKLESDSSLVMDGQVIAHGGTVALKTVPDKSSTDPKYQKTQGIWLGNTAKIDVSGGSEIEADGLGHRSGNVYDGGKVEIDAQRGFFASQAGSLIDVSGSQAEIDLLSDNPNTVGLDYQPTTLGSHAGEIEIISAEGVFIDGGMQANAGGASGTAGGTLTMIVNNRNTGDPEPEASTFPNGPRTILVSQEKNFSFTPSFKKFGDAQPSTLNGKGYISAKQLVDGGFSSLALAVSGDKGEIRFVGDIDLQLKNALALEAVKFGWERKSAADTGNVLLKATSATLGSDTFRKTTFNPVNGEGHLKVNADIIDLVGGSATSGFSSVDLLSNGDIRLKGVSDTEQDLDFIGEFKTFSKLNLTADQVYPTSLTKFTLGVSGDANGILTFNPGGNAAPVLSAMGKLTVQAPNIVQNGVINAPLGEINLDASKSVTFGGNSVTSVSAKNQIIPLGVTQGGLDWLFPFKGTSNNLVVNDPNILNSKTDKKLILEAPQKKITVTADKILQANGAVVDLSGGGDLLAYEFIPGAGGSADVLESSNTFAVMPSLSAYAPFDAKLFPSSGLKTGDSIFIGAGSGLAVGQYALLPARYALLPGAFLVTAVSTQGDVVAGSARTRVDGAAVVSGYRAVAGTDIRDQRWSEFVVEAGSIAKTRSEYNLSYASKFFADRAQRNEVAIPRLPQDAGQLVLNVKTQLELPTVKADAANSGRGGLVDIVSDNLAVVNGKTGATGIVELLSSDIDKFKVESLLLGGVRTFDAATGKITLDVKTKSVTVAENTTLKAPEVLLAATDKVELKIGAKIKADGTVIAADSELEVQGDGALLRASAGKQATIKRTGSTGAKGDLLINQNAVIAAGTGSVALDSTRQTKFAGELQLDKGALYIGAGTINLGETANVVDGLSLTNSQLSQLTVKELRLNSRGMVNLYGQLLTEDANGKAFKFGDLIIDAFGIAGKANDGKTVSLNAQSMMLANSNKTGSAIAGNGTGNLDVNAEQLFLDNGDYQLSGFNQISFNLGKGLVNRGEANLTSLGNLTVKTPFVTAENGAKTVINAKDHALIMAQASQAVSANTQGIAAQLFLEADSIDLNTALLYTTGNVSLNALQGNVSLGSNALIDVSGAVAYAGLSKPVNLSAGNISLSSQTNNVIADAGSKLLLKGINDKMSAGVLSTHAAQGQVQLNGQIDAHGVGKVNGGGFVMDAGSLDANGFNGLNSLVSNAGFTGNIELRLRNGDIVLDAGQTVSADKIKLTADTGKVTVGGTLDASGVNGGLVQLAAEDALTLESSARILVGAQGANGDGGKVTLSSIDRQADDAGIEIKSGARIDVAASGTGKEGEVQLRADRKDTDGDSIDDINIKTITQRTISGDTDVTVVAAKIYTDDRIDIDDQNTISADNQTYIDGLEANNVTNARFGNGFTIIPGVEVQSTDDLTVADDVWDLAAWRYGTGKVAGELTLRAAKDVLVEQNLSDAFAVGQIDLAENGVVTINDFLQSGPSWSYNLVAGADLNSADNRAVVADNGDIKLSDEVKVRTGTGDIAVQAGRDIVYGNNNSVIYTAGRPDDANRWGFNPLMTVAAFYAEYPLDGGDISLSAGRDILAKPTTQLVSDWLVRTGNWSRNADHSSERPTAWGIAFSGYSTVMGDGVLQHQQSVAALGGGNVSINAGGNINDLSVLIPTTGKQVGEKTSSSDPSSYSYNSNLVEVKGGGNLQLNAGGDVAGGVFYVDGGTADLHATGSLTAGTNYDAFGQGLSPILALGDSQFNVTAGKDIALEAVVDPMFIPQSQSADVDGIISKFFRYSADSGVNLTSLAGNITLENDATSLDDATNAEISVAQETMDAVKVYPASLKANALHGNIHIGGDLNMYPSAQGELELFAANAITGKAIVHMTDADPGLLPSSSFPVTELPAYKDALHRLDSSQAANMIHAEEPLHVNDKNPALISTGSGNIASDAPDSMLQFALAKPVEVKAGKDIVNTSFKIQHIGEDANSIINAGRDLKFLIPINKLTGVIPPDIQLIEVAGPGQLTVLAGRNVDMGSSLGITSIGDNFNAALADKGADISVIAGLAGGRLDANDFAEKFLANNGKYSLENQQYLDRFVGEMRTVTGDQNLDVVSANIAFDALSAEDKARVEPKLLEAIQPVFFNEIKIAGAKLAKATTKQGQDQAELELLAAIETLFPGTTLLAGNTGYSVDPFSGVVVNANTNAGAVLDGAKSASKDRPKLGNISLFFSTIQTQDGGDVNLLTPNDGISAGLAADIGLEKSSDKLGVIVKKEGDINVIARDDVDVNIARVVTAGTGSIFAGSTEQDVNAGFSPKTNISVPGVTVSYDASGLPIVEVAPILEGGGIRTSGTGDVLIIAPNGIIDAGEAGIAGNNVTLAATAIVGADNIDVGGTSVGVPVAATGSIAAGLTGVSNLTAAVSKSLDSTANVGKDTADSISKAAAALGILVVDVLGFGE